MNVLLIINDANYGTEKAYNALRVAMNLQKADEDVDVNIFLLADGVNSAIAGQETAKGYYNIERMLKSVINKGGAVKACGTCADSRGLGDIKLTDGVELSNMKEFTRWIVEADKVINF
ncbi:MAG: DsrE/DsrF/TusD sulfur relay family protein [Bacillota bacterium]